MSLVRRSSALELEIMMRQAIDAAEHDQDKGTPYLSPALVTKLTAIHQSFSTKTFDVSRIHSLHREALERRSQTTERLTRIVRNVHMAFNRFFDQDELGLHDHSEFGIPDGAARESSTRTPVWVAYADRILRGWNCRIERNAEPLPLHVIHEDLITEISTLRDAAKAVQMECHGLAQELSEQRSHVTAMRPDVTKILRLVRMSLEVALFEMDPAKTRKIMEGYGYAYHGGPGEDGSGTINEPTTESPEQPETPEPSNESPNGEPTTGEDPGSGTPQSEPSNETPGEKPQSEEPTNESPDTDKPTGQGKPPKGQNPDTQTPDTQQNPNTGSTGNGPKTDVPRDGRNKATDPDEQPAYDIFGPADEDEELQELKMIREPAHDRKPATKPKNQGGATQ